jgi:hypothetical protein
MYKIETTNNRVERLATVYEVLKLHAPVNLYSSIYIIADPKYHKHWKLLQKFERHVEIMGFAEFDRRCGLPWDDQYIFVVDDTDPEIYPMLKKSMKKLKLDDGHRLFMTKVTDETSNAVHVPNNPV